MSGSIYDGLFKETPGGYLFRAPNPWLFGAGKHYLANEAQRAEILELGRVRHPGLRSRVCFGNHCLPPRQYAPRLSSLGTRRAIAILTSASLLTSLLTVTRLRLRRLHPILMRLPRSEERLTLLAASAVVQAICLAFIIGTDVGARRHLSFGSSQVLSVCLVLLQGGVAALYFKRAASRAQDTFSRSA